MTARARPTLFLRFKLGADAQIGPGKIELLEAIAREHSIAAAARSMSMSYRRAWLLVDSMNRMFATRVVVARPGRQPGKSAELAPYGARLVDGFRRAEGRATRACSGFVDLMMDEFRGQDRIATPRKRTSNGR
ncbi:MAG TPA: ModE family transcriptional regulator [Casimicrobiaceae bacterium]|nr:ModE family transcriptional regulator [Casimicrobiaceae bacterium]